MAIVATIIADERNAEGGGRADLIDAVAFVRRVDDMTVMNRERNAIVVTSPGRRGLGFATG